MDNSSLQKNTNNLLYLIHCSFNNIVPKKDIINSMELEKVYKLAKFHSLQAISFSALEKYINTFPDEKLEISKETFEKWSKVREYIIKRNVMFAFEREKLYNFFESKGIWYLPLKGLIIDKYYPVTGWRHLTDNDILFDKSHRKLIKKFMLDSGYKILTFGGKKHDVYTKDPYYTFELHIDLFGEIVSNKDLAVLHNYYKGIKSRLIKTTDSEFGFTMRDEDFYVYMISHAFMHTCYGGTGLRTFVDFYVLLNYFKDRLDREYIHSQLEILDLVDFENQVRQISQKLFCGNIQENQYSIALTKEENEALLYYSSSGTYGTVKNSLKERLKRYSDKDEKLTTASWIKFLFRRVVPNMNFFKDNYPTLYKYKILIPFFLIKRFIKAVFIKNRVSSELKILKKIKEENK